jgi:hypothetical protein
MILTLMTPRGVYTGLAVFSAANLLLMVWVWIRSRPDSGDRLVLPAVLLGQTPLLVGILPKVFWPNSDRIQVAGSIASIILAIPAMVIGLRMIRRNLQRHQLR